MPLIGMFEARCFRLQAAEGEWASEGGQRGVWRSRWRLITRVIRVRLPLTVMDFSTSLFATTKKRFTDSQTPLRLKFKYNVCLKLDLKHLRNVLLKV